MKTKAIFLWSLPLAIPLQSLALVVVARADAPGKGIICTASLHGSRAVPCSFFQLVFESAQMTFFLNLFTFGAPTLAAYLACVIGLVILSEGVSLFRSRSENAVKSIDRADAV